ncbi:hypothetical protein EVAR_21348_1 [Eumeta japonica]|uniref:Uncharacterized protein n=1 Tax=Eumeta variegata TaxID=151549 RepID=A0A4C1YF15_EUMVA|nr:hypothetical protein EVAR_21348_1 [Eumeta japonica]
MFERLQDTKSVHPVAHALPALPAPLTPPSMTIRATGEYIITAASRHPQPQILCVAENCTQIAIGGRTLVIKMVMMLFLRRYVAPTKQEWHRADQEGGVRPQSSLSFARPEPPMSHRRKARRQRQ